MSIETIPHDKTFLHLALQGKFDAFMVSQLENDFYQKIQEHPGSVLVDLTGVLFIASMGLRMLVEGAKKIKERGERMILLKPSPLIEMSLSTAGLDKVLTIVQEEAIAHQLLTDA